jgi:hypothetical protein
LAAKTKRWLSEASDRAKLGKLPDGKLRGCPVPGGSIEGAPFGRLAMTHCHRVKSVRDSSPSRITEIHLRRQMA